MIIYMQSRLRCSTKKEESVFCILLFASWFSFFFLPSLIWHAYGCSLSMSFARTAKHYFVYAPIRVIIYQIQYVCALSIFPNINTVVIFHENFILHASVQKCFFLFASHSIHQIATSLWISSTIQQHSYYSMKWI